MGNPVKLSPEELIRIIDEEEGWAVTGGELIGEEIPWDVREIEYVSYSDSDSILRIELRDRTIEVSGDDVAMTSPGVIQIYRSGTKMQQRSQKRGGGLHPVPVRETAVRLRRQGRRDGVKEFFRSLPPDVLTEDERDGFGIDY